MATDSGQWAVGPETTAAMKAAGFQAESRVVGERQR